MTSQMSFKKTLLIFFIFICLSFCFLVLIPFGDEPDFWIRARDYVQNKKSYEEWWSPFLNIKPAILFTYFSSNLNYTSHCHVGSNPLEIFTYVNPNKCTQNDYQIIIRTLINQLIIIPFVFLFLILKSQRYFNLNRINERIDIFFISIIFPSYIYYHNLMSQEQFIYLLSLILFVFWNNLIISLIIIFLASAIDFGSSIFLIFIFIFYNSLLMLNKKKELNTKIFFILISSILLSYITGYKLLGFFLKYDLLSFLPPINTFIENIHNHHVANGFIDKYPVFLRPIITYFSFIFFTPGFLKSYILIVFITLLILYVFKKILFLKRKSDENIKFKIDEYLFDIVIVTSSIIFFVFLLPAYSNFKYYIILIPFFLRLLSLILTKYDLVVLLVMSNFFILSNLLIYRLNIFS